MVEDVERDQGKASDLLFSNLSHSGFGPTFRVWTGTLNIDIEAEMSDFIIPASNKSKRTFNPIRAIVDNLKPPKNHPKVFLNLALGDPCNHGNLKCPDVLNESIQESLS